MLLQVSLMPDRKVFVGSFLLAVKINDELNWRRAQAQKN
jgi:urease beta subunit